MRELARSITSNLSGLIISKAIPKLESIGYFEQWYSGSSMKWHDMIKVEDEGRLFYAMLVGSQGVNLGKVGFYGMINQDKFYDEKSFLINGLILTYSKKREYLGGEKSSSKIRIGKGMPEQMVGILGESKEKILETAKLLKLPLEEEVATNS